MASTELPLPRSLSVLSLVPERRELQRDVLSTLGAQFWSQPTQSSGQHNGLAYTAPGEPTALPLLAPTGIARTQLIVAGQAATLPALPCWCAEDGGFVTDRVLLHNGGDNWWATLAGRAKVQRILAQRRRSGWKSALDTSQYRLSSDAKVSFRPGSTLKARATFQPGARRQASNPHPPPQPSQRSSNHPPSNLPSTTAGLGMTAAGPGGGSEVGKGLGQGTEGVGGGAGRTSSLGVPLVGGLGPFAQRTSSLSRDLVRSSVDWVQRHWSPSHKDLLVRPFASLGAALQLGWCQYAVADFTRLSAKLDLGLPAVSHRPPGKGQPQQQQQQQQHPAFGLEGRGAWHALTLSLRQQLVGPLRGCVDLRYSLDSSHPWDCFHPARSRTGKPGRGSRSAGEAEPASSEHPSYQTIIKQQRVAVTERAQSVARHIGGMRPSLLDAAYGLDLTIPGSQGLGRLVAWWAPRRGEAMVELCLF
ncbi:hypothetical protein V8C86DRAFT_1387143 [Haematococcus lacustris]